MYMWRNCCRMAHLMSNTRELPEIGLQWLCTHCASICPTRACSDLSPYFVQAIGVFNVVCYKYNVCAPICMTWCVILGNIISWLKRIWGKRTNRMTSFECHIAFMFPWMHKNICWCKWKRLCEFWYAYFCHIKCFSYKTILWRILSN